MKKVILVTGGNRGIGLEICRQLTALDHTVILGSRDLQKGQRAAIQIPGNIIAKQLDVTDEASIRNLACDIKTEFGRLDVLINNAGLGTGFSGQEDDPLAGVKSAVRRKFPRLLKLLRPALPCLKKLRVVQEKRNAEDTSLTDVKKIMETNFYGPWRMMRAFIPLLEASGHGRIINVSSGMGELRTLTGTDPGYSLSKASLNALTIMFSNDLKDRGICVNAMCPGWVRTDMGGPDAPRDVSQGADTAVWLSTEEEIPTGLFFRDRTVIDW